MTGGLDHGRDPATHDALAAARAGDHPALDALFAREWPRLRRVLARKVGPALLQRVDLDDLVQEACAEALRRLPSFAAEQPGSFSSWLTALAVHRLQNVRRTLDAAKRSPQREQPLAGPSSASNEPRADPDALGPGPRTLAASDEGVSELQEAMAELSPIDQEVIRLARMEGLPLDEVAARVGRTRNAAALLLSRALRKLKARLDARA